MEHHNMELANWCTCW